MTTITDTRIGGQIDIGLSTIPDVNLDDPVPCSFPVSCSSPATWKYVALCCGFTRLLCEEHKVIHEKTANAAREEWGGSNVQCRHCNTFEFDRKYVRI